MKFYYLVVTVEDKSRLRKDDKMAFTAEEFVNISGHGLEDRLSTESTMDSKANNPVLLK